MQNIEDQHKLYAWLGSNFHEKEMNDLMEYCMTIEHCELESSTIASAAPIIYGRNITSRFQPQLRS